MWGERPASGGGEGSSDDRQHRHQQQFPLLVKAPSLAIVRSLPFLFPPCLEVEEKGEEGESF